MQGPPPRPGTRSAGARRSRHSPRRQRQRPRRRGSPGAGHRRAGQPAGASGPCAAARSRPAWRRNTSPPPTPVRRLAASWRGCGAPAQSPSGSRWLWPTERRRARLGVGVRAPRRLLHPDPDRLRNLSLWRLATQSKCSSKGSGAGFTPRASRRCTTAGSPSRLTGRTASRPSAASRRRTCSGASRPSRR